MARGFRNFQIIAIVFLVTLSLVMSQANDDDYEEEEPTDDDDDYTQPGQPTEDCICVPFYQCENGEVVTDGRNVINPRRRKPQPPPQELSIEKKYTPPACGPYHVCCRNPEETTVKPYVHRCGNRNPGGINGRILSAKADGEAEFGEWPWQAAILKKEGNEFAFKCGGTLIDKNHVLTIAHCVDVFMSSPDDLVVRLGEWDTHSSTEFYQHEDFTVAEVIIHGDYKKMNLNNDIAVLKLEKSVMYKPHIDSICLPKDDDDFTGRECIVTGWGTDDYESGEYANIMKEVAMPVISNADCQKQLRKTRLGRYFKLFGGFLCAGGEKGKDSCKGDGGGPLVCYRSDNTYTLAGLVSWGIECGHDGVPGVYVNVRKYINWIASITGNGVDSYWSS